MAKIPTDTVKSLCDSFDMLSKWSPEDIDDARRESFELLEFKQPRAIQFVNGFWDACMERSLKEQH